LTSIPGIATFDAIRRLIEDPAVSILRQQLGEHALRRAQMDSEFAAWSSNDVYAFEADFQQVPRTPSDLQRLVLSKLEDFQHDLLHAEFAQGPTLADRPLEVDVQNWMADRLDAEKGRSYSVERESHTVSEKAPDIRFRAKASDSIVAMEIKVAESWTLPELEDALRVQLVGQYLRDRVNRYGILLLVHQKPRVKGWQGPDGGMLTFDRVVGHLQQLAKVIAAESPHAPQAEIAVVDVSKAKKGAKEPSPR
jgi:hypothetical protein